MYRSPKDRTKPKIRSYWYCGTAKISERLYTGKFALYALSILYVYLHTVDVVVVRASVGILKAVNVSKTFATNPFHDAQRRRIRTTTMMTKTTSSYKSIFKVLRTRYCFGRSASTRGRRRGGRDANVV